jgi:hypothetical protein
MILSLLMWLPFSAVEAFVLSLALHHETLSVFFTQHETKFHTHLKQWVILQISTSTPTGDEKTGVFEQNGGQHYLLTYLLTHLLHGVEFFLETNRFSAGQEIPRILWNPKFHYRTQTCPPPVPIPNHIDPVHALISHVLKIHVNIILPSTPGSYKLSLSLRFLHQNPVQTSTLPPYVLHPPTLLLSFSLSEQYWVSSTDH